MVRAIWIGLVAVSAGVATVAAADVAMKPEDVVAARRAAYFLSGGLVSEMKEAAESGRDVRNQEFSAHALARWAQVLPTMFPAGSNVAPTRATERVWSDRPGFEAKARDYAAAAAKLADVAKAGDSAAFLAQLSATRDTCRACHQLYHVQAPTSDGKP